MSNDFEDRALEILGEIRNESVATNTKLRTIEKKVAEIDRTIRGSNGNKGLVTDLAIMQTQLEDHLKECEEGDKQSGEEKGSGNKYLTTDWLVNKAFMPILIAVVLWFLLEVGPKLIGALSNGK